MREDLHEDRAPRAELGRGRQLDRSRLRDSDRQQAHRDDADRARRGGLLHARSRAVRARDGRGGRGVRRRFHRRVHGLRAQGLHELRSRAVRFDSGGAGRDEARVLVGLAREHARRHQHGRGQSLRGDHLAHRRGDRSERRDRLREARVFLQRGRGQSVRRRRAPRDRRSRRPCSTSACPGRASCVRRSRASGPMPICSPSPKRSSAPRSRSRAWASSSVAKPRVGSARRSASSTSASRRRRRSAIRSRTSSS